MDATYTSIAFIYIICYFYKYRLSQSQTNPTVPPVMNNDPQMPVGDVCEQVCYL